MKLNTRVTTKTVRKQTTLNALRSAFAVLVLGGAFYANDSNAELVFSNGTDEVEWRVGQPIPSIDLSPDGFVVFACGAELGWVYQNFPTIAMRTIGTASTNKHAVVKAAPLDNECVIWRGDSARFIADNLSPTGV
jgi:hypothetical protein